LLFLQSRDHKIGFLPQMQASKYIGKLGKFRGRSMTYRLGSFAASRREFIALVGGAAAAWPLAARAQQHVRMRRVGALLGLAEGDPDLQVWLAAFRQTLERLGWLEGRNVHIDYRFAAADAGRARLLAKELVALQPDVILATNAPVTAALQQETRVIPIVFVAVSDPIGAGFIASLARPGGNLTGLLQYEASIIGKSLAMLKEIAPSVTRAALVANSKVSPYDYFLHPAQALAPSLGIELVPAHVENAVDIERVIESFARAPNGGLVLSPNSTTILHRDLIIALAARYRLPAVYFGRFFVTHGGLMSYGIDRPDMYRHAAIYVDRILRGDKPAELPVQAPVKFELVINFTTAKALGLTIPETLLATADELIK
jgi:putative tryptophan/tyrosine transport system substrate-binding protein